MRDATRRIFIAVQLDPVLRQAIAALERRMEEAGARLRWIRPENLHFTLRFLGHISEAELVRAQTAARSTAGGVAPFGIELRGVGAFPSPRRPQVVWVGVGRGVDALSALARRLEDNLGRERFPREAREFHAHLTLARLRDGLGHSGTAVGRALALFEDVEIGGQDVTSLLVMESLLRPQGPQYIQVEEVPLLTHEK